MMTYLVVIMNFVVAVAAIYWEKRRKPMVIFLGVSLLVGIVTTFQENKRIELRERQRVLTMQELVNPFHRVSSMTLGFWMDYDAAIKDVDETNPRYWFPTPKIPGVESSELILSILPNYPIITKIKPLGDVHEVSVNGSEYYDVSPPVAKEGRVMVDPLFDVEGIAPYFLYFQTIPVGPPLLANQLTLPTLLNLAPSGSQVGVFNAILNGQFDNDFPSLIHKHWGSLEVELRAFVRDNSATSIDAEARAEKQNTEYDRFQAHYIIPLRIEHCKVISKKLTCELNVADNGVFRLEQNYPW